MTNVGPTAKRGQRLERQSRQCGDDATLVGKVAQISAPLLGTASGARCRARWGGLKTTHCSACHESFTVVAAFDKHRAGSHARGRYCLDPAAVGLIDAGRAYRCWGYHGRDENEAAS
ncbi:hypothetical protein [Mycobacterium paraintracellulare]|uniref:FDXHR family putative zinc-binding protein n=1 Tax=Mycobacterium avium complex (MAC) TaxID=120793 RepID=UPI0019359C97|nr:hypothetical protein MINTM003_16460 [Mycobacterium paraintracellulare]BCO88391.1 hypothetical protein MINTM015_16480 [Mycobacterium paraintracellulare]